MSLRLLSEEVGSWDKMVRQYLFRTDIFLERSMMKGIIMSPRAMEKAVYVLRAFERLLGGHETTI